MENQIVESQQVKLRAVESFIPNYKKLDPEDVKNIDKIPYEDFKKRMKEDVVKVMVGMDLSQFGNMVSPETRLKQNRSVINRLMEDESMYVRNSDMSAASTVAECLDGDLRQALLFHALTKAWEKNSIQDRGSITLQTSSPAGTPPNEKTLGTPAPVAIGSRLNPGELVSTSHSINTNSYSPFKWVYDKAKMQRTKVKPAQTIPASTLSESEGNIPMDKWGNRFVLPYEMLTGGQGMRVNKLTAMVGLDADTEGVRQFGELIGVLQNGDGVTGTAKIEGITEYEGTSGDLGFNAYLNWLDEALESPFKISHVIMTKQQQRQLRAALSVLQGGQAMDQLTSVGLAPSSMTNMEGTTGVRYGRAPDGSLTAGYILGIDARYAVEKVNRAGMTIRQQAENIANQTRDVVISDTYLWARVAPEAVTILNINA